MKMDKKTLENLTSCDTALAWELVRDKVIKELTGEDVMPVPNLGEVQNFDVGGVIVKEPLSGFSKHVKRRLPMYVCLGLLHEVLSPASTCPPRVPYDTSHVNFSGKYTYEISDVKDGVSKNIVVTMEGCVKQCATAPVGGPTFIMDMTNSIFGMCDKLYVIKDVCVVGALSVRVRLGQQETLTALRGRIPIAFTLLKHRVMPQGHLHVGLPTHSRRQGHWVKRYAFRHPQDPLPPLPGDLDDSDDVILAGTKRSGVGRRRDPQDPLPPTPGPSHNQGGPSHNQGGTTLNQGSTSRKGARQDRQRSAGKRRKVVPDRSTLGSPPPPPYPSPLPDSMGPAHSQTSPLPDSMGPAHSHTSPLPDSMGPAHSQTSPLPDSMGPAHSHTSPLQDSMGPAPSQASPLPDSMGPAHSHTSPLPDSMGPAHSHTSPLPDSMGPAPSHTSPLPDSMGPAPSHPSPLPDAMEEDQSSLESLPSTLPSVGRIF